MKRRLFILQANAPWATLDPINEKNLKYEVVNVKKPIWVTLVPPPPLEESLFELFIQDYFKVLIIINNIQFHECGWPESTPSSQVKEERDRKGHPSVVCITLQCISRTDVVNITCALNFIILKNMLDFGQILN